MTTIYKILLLSFLSIIFMACGSDDSFMEGSESNVLLEFPETKTTLNIQARVWGVSGNHEMTKISNAHGDLPDSSQFQIFYTSEIFYHKKEANTLVVYAPKSSFKTLLDSIHNVKLDVVAIDNADTLNNLTNTYRARGLSKLSAYDNKSKLE